MKLPQLFSIMRNSILFCLFFQFSAFSLLAEVEPNDIWSQASTIAANGSDNGSLGGADVNDWWKITISADGFLKIRTSATGTAEIDLRIYDSNGTSQIATYDIGWGLIEETHYANLRAGTYYVHAGLWSGAGSYTIETFFNATTLSNDAEPNDSAADAEILGPAATSTGHSGFFGSAYTDSEDWFEITIPGDGKLIVNTVSDSTLEIDLRIFDSDKTTQIATYDIGWGVNEATHRDNLATGTYYIRLNAWSGYGSYTIHSQFTPATQPNETAFLTNDITAGAGILPPNGNSTGHLAYYNLGYTDPHDWWKVTLTDAADSIWIRTQSDTTAEIELRLYAAADTVNAIASGSNWGSYEEMKSANLIAGDYFVKGYAWSGFGSYSIISTAYQTVSIEKKLNTDMDLVIFPNPANISATIKFDNNFSGNGELKIMSLDGRKVQKTSISFLELSQGVELEVQSLPPGIYIVELQSETQKNLTGRIVKQ